MTTRNEYYNFLRADETTTPKALEATARNLMAQFVKEEQKGDERASQRYNDTIEAFAILTNLSLRNAYDAGGYDAIDSMPEIVAKAIEEARQRLLKPQYVNMEFPVVETPRKPLPPLPENVKLYDFPKVQPK